MNNIIEMESVVKKYGAKKALNNISFKVRTGTCFGLLGPNGAGKSTTMKILTGIIEYDQGLVKVLGLDAKSLKDEIRKQVGYVPQEITLYDKLTAYQNLRLFGDLYGVKGKELKQRIEEVLEKVGLKDHMNRAVHTFSGGMKRRVNLAVALLHRPKLLILDEPTVGVDPQSRNHIFDLIRKLKNDGVTIIYSTHYMEEVEVLCDDIAIIDQGEVIAQGVLHDVLDQYTKDAVFVESEQLKKQPTFAHTINVYQKDKGWIIESEDVLGTIQDITYKSMKDKFKLKELEIVRPTLEHVFLSLTGTSLRD